MINQQVISEYTKAYCLGLEAAYGEGMMAEGGTIAIDRLFKNIQISKKITVDIGSGLGGVAFHLAKNYETTVTGLEINPWMVQESTNRIPPPLKNLLKFVLLEQDDLFPFPDNSIDVVYSKGVLVHVQDKGPLLTEVMRILKPDGILLIHDWLAPCRKTWGPLIQKLINLERLILFPETTFGYKSIITKMGFKNISITDVTQEYCGYNREIVTYLETLSPEKQEALTKKFGASFIADAASGYHFIAEAMDARELFSQKIYASKP